TYQKAHDAGEKPKSVPERDLAMEPLVEVLDRKRTVHFHSHRADDLMTAVRIAEEFGFELVLHHVTEGYRVAPELAKHHIPCSLTLVDSPGGKLEAAAIIEESAAILHKAGVKLAINTDDFITDSRIFLRTASAAVRSGIPDEEVLKAVTLNPAEMLHLEGRIGSLEKGKDADFVVLSGPPFSSYRIVLATHRAAGRLFDRANPRPPATHTGGLPLPVPGGFPAWGRVAPPLARAAVPAATSGGSAATPSKRLVISAGRI